MRVPCKTCPWRESTPRGGFPGGIIDYKLLLDMTFGQSLRAMQCHCTPNGAQAEVCVGFALQVGFTSPGYRLAVALGRADPEDLATDELLLSLENLVLKHGGVCESRKGS